MAVSRFSKAVLPWAVFVVVLLFRFQSVDGSGMAFIDSTAAGVRANFAAIIDPRNTNLMISLGTGNVFQWNLNTNTINSTIPLTGATGTNPIRNGLWLDEKKVWSNSTRRAIACLVSQTNMIYDINLDTKVATLVYGFTGSGNLEGCVIDFARATAWLTLNRQIKRVPMAQPGTTWPEAGTSITNTGAILTTTFGQIDPVGGFAYFGALATLFRVNLNFTGAMNTANAFTRISNVGGGNLLNLVIDRVNNFQYLGTDVGLALRFPADSFSGATVAFFGNQNLEGVLVDSITGTTYWLSNINNVFRLDKNTFSTTSDSVTLVNSPLAAGVILPNRQTAVLPNRNTTAGLVMRVKLFDCAIQPTCGPCVVDTYCGWCVENNRCIQKEFCNQTLASSAVDCPAVTLLSPSSGATNGGTKVTVTGKQFVNHPSTGCLFGSTFVPATFVNNKTLTCIAPAGTGTVAVEVSYLNTTVTFNGLTFTYYSCAGSTCGGCISVNTPDCGFCLSSGVCTVNGSCAAQSNNFQTLAASCPALTSIQPPESVDSGGANVTVTGSFFQSGVLYQCKFGTLLVDATFVTSTTLRCIAPASLAPGNAVVAFSVVYKATGIAYTGNTLNFQYFNCDLSTNCKSCVVGKCTWCPETLTCSAIGQGSCPNTVSTSANCPVLNSTNPPSVFLNSATNLIVSGNFFTPSFSDKYKCQFSDPANASVILAAVPAQFSSSNALLCQSPAFSSAGESILTVLHQGSQYTDNTLSVLAYDCSGNTCGSCSSNTLTPLCKWCDLDNVCKTTSQSCPSSSSVTTCASLVSVSATKAHVSGGTPIDIIFSNPIPATGFQCNFGGILTNASKQATSTIRCLTPAASSGVVGLSFLFNGVAYVPDVVSFQFFQCGDLVADCASCLSTPLCSYCLPFACQDASSTSCAIAFTTTQCPQMTSLQPTNAEVLKPVTVAINGNGLFSSGDAYECFLGGVSVGQASFVSGSQITCTFTPTKLGIADFKIVLSNNDFVVNVLPFEVYECGLPLDSNNCSNCAANPSNLCGWCIKDNKCSISSECSDSATWTDTCPVITKIDPDYADIGGNTPIQITGTFFPPNIDLKCRFDVTEVPATYINATKITCTSPPFVLTKKRTPSTATSIGVYFNNQVVSAASVPFSFLDCHVDVATSACSQCFKLQTDPRCNFCMFEGTCSPSQKCDVQWPIASAVGQCPAISQIVPVTGPQEGGTSVTIFGNSFLNTSQLLCKFGDITAPAKFVSSNQVICVTPSSAPKEVAVTLLLNGKEFTSNQILFEYQSAAARLATILLSILGAIAAVALIVAAIVFVFYKKKKEKKLKLQEPDYINLAFSGLLPEFSVSKSVEDPLYSLGELLLASDFSLVSAVVSSAQMSEMDQVSRALVFVFETKNHTIDLLKYFITAEIQSAETEGTLFKANSVVSRMASVYSKLIGLPYLWRTLALAMHELNDWGKVELPSTDSNSNYSGSSRYEVSMKGMQSIMSPSSMEVDPNKMTNTEDAAVNQLQLMLIAQKLFGTIAKSVDFMPTPLRLMYQHINEEVGQKFSGQNSKVVGSFIFLRFICPAILAPHVYGLLPEPPNQECQRYLILLSKTLQNLSLGTLPGKKEEYMQKMNDFIMENQDTLKGFVQSVINIKADDSQAVQIPDKYYSNALAFLHNFILAKGVEFPPEHPNAKEKNEQLKQILKDIGAPLNASSI